MLTSKDVWQSVLHTTLTSNKSQVKWTWWRMPSVVNALFSLVCSIGSHGSHRFWRKRNTGCVQDKFHWSCHGHHPGAGPFMIDVAANCTSVLGSQNPKSQRHYNCLRSCVIVTPTMTVYGRMLTCSHSSTGACGHHHSLRFTVQRQLMEMQHADTCLSRVLFCIVWQRNPSRRERVHEAADVLCLVRHWGKLRNSQAVW